MPKARKSSKKARGKAVVRKLMDEHDRALAASFRADTAAERKRLTKKADKAQKRMEHVIFDVLGTHDRATGYAK